ncbi:HD domain-containing protein [Patescibacteria group bacterium]|nr:HD domain-containing protein [Patescibacteria group bacterium]MBU1673969.1 HD domain-containing protein [Patescibacteria group bacterium]MBU1962957.1 HD domain-containing protein [Patescibacteria group bacterium]
MEKIVNFFYEMGVLKRQRHTGSILAGVKDPDSLADHTCRAAIIAYVMAGLEGADEEKTACMVLFHDIGECRVGDQHKVGARYWDHSEPEQKAYEEQVQNLPKEIEKKLLEYFKEFNSRDKKEGVVAKDADWVEMAMTAKEFAEQGYESMNDWVVKIAEAVETDSAKEMIEKIKTTNSTDWWQDLKKMTYKKLPV